MGGCQSAREGRNQEAIDIFFKEALDELCPQGVCGIEIRT